MKELDWFVKTIDYVPESVLFETMIFDHEGGTEWLGIVGKELATRVWYL